MTVWLVAFTFPLLADEGATADELRTVERIAELVEAAGYTAEHHLHSGRPEIDSLLAEVDLVAVGPEHAVVVQVMWNRASPVEWFEASHLRTATWAIQEWKQAEERKVRVEPMLVLVDCEVADSLERFLEDEDFAVARLSGQDLEEVDTAGPPRRRELAREWLDLRPVAFAGPREEGRS